MRRRRWSRRRARTVVVRAARRSGATAAEPRRWKGRQRSRRRRVQAGDRVAPRRARRSHRTSASRRQLEHAQARLSRGGSRSRPRARSSRNVRRGQAASPQRARDAASAPCSTLRSGRPARRAVRPAARFARGRADRRFELRLGMHRRQRRELELAASTLDRRRQCRLAIIVAAARIELGDHDAASRRTRSRISDRHLAVRRRAAAARARIKPSLLMSRDRRSTASQRSRIAEDSCHLLAVNGALSTRVAPHRSSSPMTSSTDEVWLGIDDGSRNLPRRQRNAVTRVPAMARRTTSSEISPPSRVGSLRRSVVKASSRAIRQASTRRSSQLPRRHQR